MMTQIQLPRKKLLLYLMMAPLSCLIFILYICCEFWMFFSCLFAYFIQLGIWAFLSDYGISSTRKISVRNDMELAKLDAQYRIIRFTGVLIIVLTVILDTFPFFATCDWFCYDMVLHIPKYDGGILVSIMTIITILGWIFFLFEIKNEFESPSSQYNQHLKNEEEIKIRKKKVLLQAETHHRRNVLLYGEGYKEICPQFIFNENEKTVWLCQSGYSFDEIIDAKIEDFVTQHITGGNIITNTKTGSMVGRAVVGGVLKGDVGAIIGGTTARKESIVMPTEINAVHQYKVLITTSNISNPLIVIPFEGNGMLAQKCLATLKAIIYNNRRDQV